MKVSGSQVDEMVADLYSALKRPVSIEEVASRLGFSSSDIRQIVDAHLRMKILDGTECGLEPGSAMGFYE